MPQPPRDKVAPYVIAAALVAVLGSLLVLSNPLSRPDRVLLDDSAFLRRPIGILASFVPRLAEPLPAETGLNPEYPGPLARLLWWLEFRLFNTRAAGYQIVGILLFALGVALACVALTRWARSGTVGLLGALVVALHPSLLPALLLRYQGALLASILVWAMVLALRAARPRVALAVLFGVCAAFAGPWGAVAGPVALAIYFSTRDEASRRAALWSGVASLAVAALWAVAASYLRGPMPQVGTSGELPPVSGGIAAVLSSAGLQILHTLLPVPLLLERAVPVSVGTSVGLSLWFVAATGGLVWLAVRKRETLVPAVWLLAGALLPALEAAGRRAPVTTAPAATSMLVGGLALLLATLVVRPAPQPRKQRAPTRASWPWRLGIVALVPLVVLRLWYAAAWGDDVRMAGRALALSPSNPQYLCQRGWELLDRGNARDAMPAFAAALKPRPDYARAQCGMGQVSIAWEGELRRYEERLFLQGINALTRAAELDKGYAAPLVQLASTLAREGRPQGAMAAAQQAVKVAPDWAEAHAALGRAHLWQGQFPQAIAEARRALRLQPDVTGAQMVLVDASDPLTESQAPYLKESDLAQPAEPGWSSPDRVLLQGNAYLRRLKPGEGLVNYQGLLTYKPGPDLRAMTQLNMSYAYEMEGQFSRAREALSAVQVLGCAPQWKRLAAERLARVEAHLREMQG